MILEVSSNVTEYGNASSRERWWQHIWKGVGFERHQLHSPGCIGLLSGVWLFT